MFLLDTQVVLWLAVEPSRLTENVLSTLRAESTSVYVSAVSAWEYGQKRKLKPDQLPWGFDKLISLMPMTKLAFEFDLHGYAESLPLLHRDPFDRMLVAQALHHGMTLVTKDREIHRYPVKTLW